jgi:DNA-binding NarL/FixJ family response regulator/type II secretory pathway predicted ATPase ExeA
VSTASMTVPVKEWPLVGRDDELETLAQARADAGCRGVIITAPAGVGKSRVARAACESANDALVEWVQATRSAATVPLAALAGIVPEEARSDDVVQLMRRCAESLAARAGRRPVLVAIDDAQLLDPVSAALVLHLASSGTVFVLATVREGEPLPDAVAALYKDAGARRIELHELADEDVRTLVERALGDPVEEAALRWVTEISRGNPLYVHELVDGALEQGALVHEAGFWHLHGRPAAGRSLIELVEQRMAGLGDAQREVVELLALGEPLTADELIGLSSESAVLDVEARGLLELRGEEVGLSHPLYGETVQRALPALRARALRRRIAATLTEREPLTPDDALRIARLQLDAGGTLSPELVLEAAAAANLAGDPDLGGELASRAEGLSAALLLAQAHAMRNRYEEAEAVLAAAEPLAPGHPQVADYVRRRVWLLHWGLRRSDEIPALMSRARAWPPADGWEKLLGRLERTYAALAGGPMALEEANEISADARVAGEARRGAASLHALSLLLAGRGDEAAVLAWKARPPVPLRDSGDSGALAVLGLVGVEAGYDWAQLEAYMAAAVRAAVRASDHDAAGLAAFTFARLRFLRGAYHDAARWLAEAELHLQVRDTFGVMVNARALEVGIAYFTREFDAAAIASERLETESDGRAPIPTQQVHLARGRGWAARLRSDAEAGLQLLAAADGFEAMPGVAAALAYEAFRAGAPAAPALEVFAARCSSRMVSAYAAHATARDGAERLAAAEELAAIGALSYAVEAASQAAAAFLTEGRQDSARRAAHRAEQWHIPDQGGTLPRIDGLDSTAVALTRREAQLIDLAAKGLSNNEMADRVVLSVRTVETHLYRAMQKLGVRDRRELRS